jgi:hypothetical protein
MFSQNSNYKVILSVIGNSRVNQYYKDRTHKYITFTIQPLQDIKLVEIDYNDYLVYSIGINKILYIYTDSVKMEMKKNIKYTVHILFSHREEYNYRLASLNNLKLIIDPDYEPEPTTTTTTTTIQQNCDLTNQTGDCNKFKQVFFVDNKKSDIEYEVDLSGIQTKDGEDRYRSLMSM